MATRFLLFAILSSFALCFATLSISSGFFPKGLSVLLASLRWEMIEARRLLELSWSGFAKMLGGPLARLPS
jgi:hypothetical protein